MTLSLHNTLSGKQEVFRPLEAGSVSFYSCGPTVYDYAHIGNFRSFLLGDTLRRWLESPLCAAVDPLGKATGGFGYAVTHVMNITDVGHMTDDAVADGGGEDKMEAAAARLKAAKKAGKLPEGVDDIDPGDPYAIAAFYAGAFIEDAKALGMRVAFDADADPTLLPRASEHVKGMLEIVIGLLEKGCAYRKGDAVYFDTQAFPEYGALSGNTLDKIREGAGGRVSEAEQSQKKHPADFLLWKADSRHLMRWDPSALLGREVDLGEGYPGWHIECSAMALERLAPMGSAHAGMIDLHSGGEDNIFPHHECEIAQSRCYTGKESFARYWVHGRHLMVEGAKMSKSAGNFYTLRDLLGRGFDPAAIRLELIKTHYRKNANFTEQGLRDSTRMIERWRRFVESGESSGAEGERNAGVIAAFSEAMNDDLNTAGAIGAVNAWVGDTASPTRADAALLREFDGVFGTLGLSASEAGGGDDELAGKVEALIERRTAARAAKDWGAADAVRDELAALGVEIKDGPEGTTWARKASL
ncbi:MAG: cysteine--tRNA ligase [Phycisphaeraceae bacterium]|nr:cysteine--tRNA ligase [Phycisphaeraceae bacterium]MCB9847185.1 cysteine--tRNA ligase [Phycisphaeraceae bacterium]